MRMMDFDEVTVQRIPRSENERADILTKLASSATTDIDPTVQLEYLQYPTVERKQIMEIHQAPYWMDPIIAFLEKETLPDDIIEAQKLERRADKFLIHEGKLLRKSITKKDMHPFLQCPRPEEAELALVEIHEGM